jgi:hypothetical protein
MRGLCQTSFPVINYRVALHLLLNKNMAYKAALANPVKNLRTE